MGNIAGLFAWSSWVDFLQPFQKKLEWLITGSRIVRVGVYDSMAKFKYPRDRYAIAQEIHDNPGNLDIDIIAYLPNIATLVRKQCDLVRAYHAARRELTRLAIMLKIPRDIMRYIATLFTPQDWVESHVTVTKPAWVERYYKTYKKLSHVREDVRVARRDRLLMQGELAVAQSKMDQLPFLIESKQQLEDTLIKEQEELLAQLGSFREEMTRDSLGRSVAPPRRKKRVKK